MNLKYLDDGAVSVYGFYTGNQPDWRQVPVVAATPRGEQLVVDVGNGLEIIWTPAVDTNEVLGIPALEAASLKPGAWVFPATEQADRILENPEHPPEYQDFIIWFPSQPQTAPIYLSLSVRYAPGVVSGAGEDVAGIWLDHASSGIGAPIPTAVVDVLRGRTYNSFDSFRRAFWREVSRVPELADQLTVINLKNSQKGRSPLVSDIEVSGKRIRFELHHIVRIVDGGGVYDVDNLRLNTPKNHIKLHDGG
nr:S-type pyocin domain-containing protein [uncultured Pseudomonas sp.]